MQLALKTIIDIVICHTVGLYFLGFQRGNHLKEKRGRVTFGDIFTHCTLYVTPYVLLFGALDYHLLEFFFGCFMVDCLCYKTEEIDRKLIMAARVFLLIAVTMSMIDFNVLFTELGIY